MDKTTMHMFAFTLAMVGALNWGLIALLNFNVVDWLIGSMPIVERIVYLLIGSSAVYLLTTHQRYCKYCNKK